MEGPLGPLEQEQSEKLGKPRSLDTLEYLQIQNYCIITASSILFIPIQEALDSIARVDAFGPIADPTLYNSGKEQLADMTELLEAFLNLQTVAKEIFRKAPMMQYLDGISVQYRTSAGE